MMIQNELLERMCSRDRLVEMMAELMPMQYFIMALRLDRLNYAEVADELGISDGLVHMHVSKARQRLLGALPELERERAARRARTGYVRRWHRKPQVP